jgi:hypothetical protein
MDIPTQCQVVGMGAVRAEDAIARPQVRRNADRHRLLADTEMRRAAHLAGRDHVADLFFGIADDEHVPKLPEQPVNIAA